MTKIFDAEIAVPVLQTVSFKDGNGGHVHGGTVGLDPKKRCFEGREGPVLPHAPYHLLNALNRATPLSCRCFNI